MPEELLFMVLNFGPLPFREPIFSNLWMLTVVVVPAQTRLTNQAAAGKLITFYFTTCVKDKTVVLLTYTMQCQAPVLPCLCLIFMLKIAHENMHLLHKYDFLSVARNPNYVVSPTTGSF